MDETIGRLWDALESSLALPQETVAVGKVDLLVALTALNDMPSAQARLVVNETREATPPTWVFENPYSVRYTLARPVEGEGPTL